MHEVKHIYLEGKYLQNKKQKFESTNFNYTGNFVTLRTASISQVSKSLNICITLQ